MAWAHGGVGTSTMRATFSQMTSWPRVGPAAGEAVGDDRVRGCFDDLVLRETERYEGDWADTTPTISVLSRERCAPRRCRRWTSQADGDIDRIERRSGFKELDCVGCCASPGARGRSRPWRNRVRLRDAGRIRALPEVVATFHQFRAWRAWPDSFHGC